MFKVLKWTYLASDFPRFITSTKIFPWEEVGGNTIFLLVLEIEGVWVNSLCWYSKRSSKQSTPALFDIKQS